MSDSQPTPQERRELIEREITKNMYGKKDEPQSVPKPSVSLTPTWTSSPTRFGYNDPEGRFWQLNDVKSTRVIDMYTAIRQDGTPITVHRKAMFFYVE